MHDMDHMVMNSGNIKPTIWPNTIEKIDFVMYQNMWKYQMWTCVIVWSEIKIPVAFLIGFWSKSYWNLFHPETKDKYWKHIQMLIENRQYKCSLAFPRKITIMHV